ncbi:MAG: hypothetical protein V3V41_00895 [Candidatus Heimdallarchaeota archaeon]
MTITYDICSWCHCWTTDVEPHECLGTMIQDIKSNLSKEIKSVRKAYKEKERNTDYMIAMSRLASEIGICDEMLEIVEKKYNEIKPLWRHEYKEMFKKEAESVI